MAETALESKEIQSIKNIEPVVGDTMKRRTYCFFKCHEFGWVLEFNGLNKVADILREDASSK